MIIILVYKLTQGIFNIVNFHITTDFQYFNLNIIILYFVFRNINILFRNIYLIQTYFKNNS